MPKAYEDVIAECRAQAGSDSHSEHSEAFRRGCKIASDVIGWRVGLDLTQAEVAARCGMDVGYIERIESAAVGPAERPLELIKLAYEANLGAMPEPA